MIPTLFFSEIMYDRDLDKFRYILTGDCVRLWDDRNIIYHEASRKCQFHNATNSLITVDVENCPMGTRSYCARTTPNAKSKWTNGNKTKVSDTQFNQNQLEELLMILLTHK